MSGVIVEVSARTFVIPFECPCCGAAPESELTIALAPSAPGHAGTGPARRTLFPYCRSCVAHARAWSAARTAASSVAYLGIAAGILVAVAARVAIGVAVAGCAIPIAMALGTWLRARAKAALGPACASPETAVAYVGWSAGVHAFSFESPTYTARFAEHNAATLVNVSAKLHALIEGHRIARLVVPTPAAPVTVVSPPPTADEWIAKLEASTSRVGHRNTLQRALEVVHEPEDRRRLLAAACRLELASVLDRIDDRSSTAARRLQLDAAILHVRGDNLTDELRATVLGELEARVQALG